VSDACELLLLDQTGSGPYDLSTDMAASGRTIEMLRWHAGLTTDGPRGPGSSVDELLFEREPSLVET
jgi:hypothetical protein